MKGYTPASRPILIPTQPDKLYKEVTVLLENGLCIPTESLSEQYNRKARTRFSKRWFNYISIKFVYTGICPTCISLLESTLKTSF